VLLGWVERKTGDHEAQKEEQKKLEGREWWLISVISAPQKEDYSSRPAWAKNYQDPLL
jgi:hypothetical protein